MVIPCKKAIFLIITVLILTNTVAQRYTISGYVKDKNNGESLIGANIFIKESSVGTVTNTYGFYSLSINPSDYTLVYSYLGYKSRETTISLDRDITLNVELEAAPDSIDEVIIIAERRDDNIRSTKISNVKISSKVINRIPVIMGETDVIKALTLLPGVISAGEVSSSLSIRGGARDQNLLLLDEAIVYNASHLGGFFSVFNNDAIFNHFARA